MSNWAGFRSNEFGAFPVQLEFAVDSYVGPFWVIPAIVHRTGWLMAAEVVMETTFDRTREIIYAGTDEDGEPISEWVLEALFSMHGGFPQEAQSIPPDELEDALDAAYWDFLGRCDLTHLRDLEEKEKATALALSKLDYRRKEVFEKVEAFISSLYAQRRRERSNKALAAVIDTKVIEIEEKQQAADDWFKKRRSDLANDLKEFDAQVMDSLQNHGQLTRLFTIHWKVNPSRKKLLSQREIAPPWQPPFELRDRKDHGSTLPLDLVQRSVFRDFKKTSKPVPQEVPVKLEELDKISNDIAIKNALQKPIKKAPVHVQKQSKRERTVLVYKSVPPKLLKKQNRSSSYVKKKEQISGPKNEKREDIRTDFLTGATPVKCGTNETEFIKKVELEITTASKAARPSHVIIGDRVLLRFEDFNKPRVQYLIQGMVNDESKGVLGINDEKALAILDRQVGDRVCLPFGFKNRFAVIEKILNFDQNGNQ